MPDTSPRNCVRSSERYWLFNIFDLFAYPNLWPSNQMSLDSKLNCIMRSTIIVFALLAVMGFRFALLFLVLAAIINLIFYFMYRSLHDE
jgi:hypothetical protein